MFPDAKNPSPGRTRPPRLAWPRPSRPSGASASRSTGPRRPVNLTSDPAQLHLGPDSTGPRTQLKLTAERAQLGHESKPTNTVKLPREARRPARRLGRRCCCPSAISDQPSTLGSMVGTRAAFRVCWWPVSGMVRQRAVRNSSNTENQNASEEHHACTSALHLRRLSVNSRNRTEHVSVGRPKSCPRRVASWRRRTT